MFYFRVFEMSAKRRLVSDSVPFLNGLATKSVFVGCFEFLKLYMEEFDEFLQVL